MNTFDYLGKNLRSVMLDGEPWFVAADVCQCLSLKIVAGHINTSHHTKHLSKDEKRNLMGRGREELAPLFHGMTTRVSVVSESGLYKLIMRAQPSRPEVAAFQNWVTREVLPAIRKTGGYMLNEDARQTAHADTKEAMPLPQEFMDMEGCRPPPSSLVVLRRTFSVLGRTEGVPKVHLQLLPPYLHPRR